MLLLFYAAVVVWFPKTRLTRSPPSAWGSLFSGRIPAQFVTFGPLSSLAALTALAGLVALMVE